MGKPQRGLQQEEGRTGEGESGQGALRGPHEGGPKSGTVKGGALKGPHEGGPKSGTVVQRVQVDTSKVRWSHTLTITGQRPVGGRKVFPLDFFFPSGGPRSLPLSLSFFISFLYSDRSLC